MHTLVFLGGETCSTFGEERCIQGCDGGNLRDRDHLEDIGLYVRIILKWISENYVGLDWIDLA